MIAGVNLVELAGVPNSVLAALVSRDERVERVAWAVEAVRVVLALPLGPGGGFIVFCSGLGLIVFSILKHDLILFDKFTQLSIKIDLNIIVN